MGQKQIADRAAGRQLLPLLLKQWRQEEELTRAEMAEKLHTERRAYDQWESGRRVPSIATLRYIIMMRVANMSMDKMKPLVTWLSKQ